MESFYSEDLLTLYTHPLNKTRLSKFDYCHLANNFNCGDQIEICLKYDKDDKIEQVGWTGDGCAVSQASASILTEYLKGKSKLATKKITPAKMLKILNLTNLNPSREACALLALSALKNI